MVKSAVVLLAGLSAFLITAAGVSSTAAFPGRNGTILASDGPRLYTISADGRRKSVVRGIRVLRSFNAAQAAWSPDGTRIVFAGRRGGIFVADAAARVKRVTRRGYAPAWSPDGTRIVFTLGDWLYVVRSDGRGLSRLFRGHDAQWSPDGTQLAFQARDSGFSDIFVASLDGSRRSRLTNAWSGECSPGVPGEVQYTNPEWAPDGRRLAFVEWSSCGRNLSSSIFATTVDGSQWQLLAESNANPESSVSAPAWAPDGGAIAYVDDQGDGADWGLSVLVLGGRARWIAKLVPFAWRPVCNVRGGSHADRLAGKTGSELICGLGGDDSITGGAGSDRLFGETGNDRFFANDGEFDVVGCGAGRDSVVADRADLVGLDCEQVARQ